MDPFLSVVASAFPGRAGILFYFFSRFYERKWSFFDISNMDNSNMEVYFNSWAVPYFMMEGRGGNEIAYIN